MAVTMCAVYHGKMREDALVVVKASIGNYLSLRGGWKKMANEKRLIDADKLFNNLADYWGIPKDWDGRIHPICDDALSTIENFPTVDAVEVVHGRWVNTGGRRKMDLHCSVCNRRASNFVGGYEDWWDLWMPKYCPNCGAKMDGDGNGA